MTMWNPSPPFPHITELNIGHFLIGEAMFVGSGSFHPPDAPTDG